jgi:hypothetical protein
MCTYLQRLPIVALALLVTAFSSATAQSTTSSTPSAGVPSAPSPAAGVPAAGSLAPPSQPSFATNRGVVNPTNRNQVAIRPGTVVATRSLSDSRRGNAVVQGVAPVTSVAGAATAFDLAQQQRTAQQSAAQQSALRQLASMDSRLDDLVAAVNAATGSERDQALATAVQELASQITAMRQALLASGFTSFDRLADGQTIFISPSSVQAQSRRSALGTPATITDVAGVPLITNLGSQPVPASGMSAQAAQRRGGDPNEPVVATDGF